MSDDKSRHRIAEPMTLNKLSAAGLAGAAAAKLVAV